LRRAAAMAHTMATSSPERNSAHLPWIPWFLWRKFRAEHYWVRTLCFVLRLENEFAGGHEDAAMRKA